jgi:DNA-binding CsgD family transcriptional regulator
MEPLRTRDFQAILRLLEGVYAATDLDAFAAHVTRELPTVVRCDLATYNELNHDSRRIRWLLHGADKLIPDAERIFVDRMHENPVVMHNYRRRRSPPVKTTDFVSQRQFRQRGIYTDFYGPLRLEHVMVAKLPSEPSLSVAVATLRSGSDFTERERRILHTLQPHLIQAYRNAEFLADRRHEVMLLQQGIDALGLGLIVLGADQRIGAISMQARLWLAAYFGVTEPQMTKLPDALWTWLRRQASPAANGRETSAPRAPLVVERDDRRLVARVLSGSGERLIVLEEQRTALRPTDLRTLGLTPREAEVLAWVALGKTNGDTGAILGISARTVQHTLERIYGKLGVHTRAAAAARAVRAAFAG